MAVSFATLVAILMTGCSGEEPVGGTDMSDYFSTKEMQRELARCLQDRGWDASYDESTGSVGMSYANEQEAAIEADIELCNEEIGVPTGEDLTEADYKVAYQWYSEIAECLSNAGWDVPEQPSEQAFLSSYNTQPWIPWSEVPPTELREARKVCPNLQPQT